MAYKPVPLSPKICVHCNTVYYAKDKRRQYCSSSCNTLAWMARRGLSGADQPQTKPKQTGATLDPSWQNMGILVGSSLLADATKATLNAVFDVEPTNREVMDQLNEIKQMLQRIDPGEATTGLKEGYRRAVAVAAVQELPRTEIEAQKSIMVPQTHWAIQAPTPKPTGTAKLPKPDTAGR